VAVDAGDRRARRAILLRLAAGVLLLSAVFGVAKITGLTPSIREIHRWGSDLGPVGPIVYVPAGIVLNCLFVPFPPMAAAAGLIFGTVEGTALAVLVVAGAATAQLLLGRRVAGERAEAILGERGRTLSEFLERRGFFAVFYLRLIPALPFTSLNYASGLSRLRPGPMFAGTALAVAPRVFAYAALGRNITNLGSTQAKVAFALLIVEAILAAFLARRQILAERRRGAGEQNG